MTSTIVDYSSCESPYGSAQHQGDEYSPDIANTLRSLKAKIRSCKAENNRIIESHERLSITQEKKGEVNVVILQILSKLQR